MVTSDDALTMRRAITHSAGTCYLVITLSLVGFACLLAGVAHFCLPTARLLHEGSGVGHKSDVEMIDWFRTHRGEFDDLVAMMREDVGLWGFSLRDAQAANRGKSYPIAEDRVKEYARLLKAVNTDGGITTDGDRRTMWMAATVCGRGGSGETRKGFAFAEEPPSPLVANLDGEMQQQAVHSGYLYRPIDGNWYLYWHRWQF